MAFRLFSRSDVFFDSTGQILAGGTVEFFEDGTTTPANVYSDQALSVNLGSTEVLDAAGRFATQIWGNQSYRVRFRDANGTLVAEDDPVSDPAGVATSIPSLTGHSGELLTNNGAVLQWIEYLSKQLPDMNGNGDKILTTDGTEALWRAATEVGVPDFDDTSGTVLNFTLGSKRIMAGTDTFPVPSVSPPHGATKAITFPVAFAGAPFCVLATPNKITVASSGFRPVIAVEATATTATFDYNINENTTDPGADISVTVPFSWLAIGEA